MDRDIRERSERDEKGESRERKQGTRAKQVSDNVFAQSERLVV